MKLKANVIFLILIILFTSTPILTKTKKNFLNVKIRNIYDSQVECLAVCSANCYQNGGNWLCPA